MHIILANRWYPPHSGYGGVAVYNRYLGRALVQLGHKVTAVAARWSPEAPEIEDDQGVAVHRLLVQHQHRLHQLPVVGRYMRALAQWRYSRQVARKLNHLTRRDRPDVIEFAEVNAEAFTYLRQQQRCPVVVRCHTPTFVLRNYYRPEEMPYDTRLISAMEKYCIRQADALTAPSHDMAQTIAAGCNDISAGQFTVIPNALDVSLFSPVPLENGSAAGTPTVLHVGRLDRTKGIEILAQAIPLVLQQVPETRFVFVGGDRPDGNGSTWQTRLSAFFRQQGLNGQVHFTGSVDEATLLHWYHQADIAVVPSILYESFSYTCAQAMAAGLPVVASRIGGIPETVGNGIHGLLVEPNNINELAQSLSSLLGNLDLQEKMGQAGRVKAEQEFEGVKVANKFLQVANLLLEAAPIHHPMSGSV